MKDDLRDDLKEHPAMSIVDVGDRIPVHLLAHEPQLGCTEEWRAKKFLASGS